ncbi:hypothetical protein BS50DRAFT_641593 [Corynespora cassiicola Philippines]|uniref:Uncharacterized protein n=1 Tax=Corynespora cassiicola Philippines TaxID=1448308 RepID=A0A2T2MZL9_CORCC|nr:hypothetical protein BS50DRAFT_641593 [Corynespora cassiicola Philippines]
MRAENPPFPHSKIAKLHTLVPLWLGAFLVMIQTVFHCIKERLREDYDLITFPLRGKDIIQKAYLQVGKLKRVNQQYLANRRSRKEKPSKYSLPKAESRLCLLLIISEILLLLQMSFCRSMQRLRMYVIIAWD